MKNINEILLREKQGILKKENLSDSLRVSAWDREANNKVVYVRDSLTDKMLKKTVKLPMFTNFSNYKVNLVTSIEIDEEKEREVAEFIVNSSVDELKFFLSQMANKDKTAWFVKDYIFTRPMLRQAVDLVIEKGKVEKVRTLFAFLIDDFAKFKLDEITHPNTFSAYRENRCRPETLEFLDEFLDSNIELLNKYFDKVQVECLGYKTFEEYFEQISYYNALKELDYENQINNPFTLFKSFIVFKKLNERKVWNIEENFSINKFVDRDEKRQMYDDFDLREKSEVQILYEDIHTL